MVGELVYLEFTTSSNLSVDKEIGRRIGKASSILTRHGTDVGNNSRLKTQISCQYMTLVFLVHFYTEANLGQNMLLKSVK